MHRLLLLVVLVTACGDDGVRHTPDAAPHDGPLSPDAPRDAPIAPVTLTVTLAGVPNPGVHVYFLAADNSVVLATTTDASGMASAVMADGGSVTAIDPYRALALGGVSDEVYTYMGVKPGDHLQLATPATPPAITVTATLPVASTPGVTSYSIQSPCGEAEGPADGSGAPLQLSLTLSGCGTTTEFLVTAYGQLSEPVDYFHVQNVAIADAGTVTFPGQAYTAGGTRTYTFQNPPGTTNIFFQDRLFGDTGDLYDSPSSTNTGSAVLAMADFAGAHDLMSYNYYAGGVARYTMVEWGAYSATYTTDVAARELARYQTSPSYDPASHSIAMQEGSGAPPDFVQLQLDANRQADARTWAWHVAAPHATTIVLPLLPTDVYDYNVGSGDNGYVQSFTAGQITGGYDAVRAGALSNAVSTVDLAVGPSGTLTLEDFVLTVAKKSRVLGNRTR